MKLFRILVLLALSSAPAKAQVPSIEECCMVFAKISADIHLAPNVSALGKDVIVGDVSECLMEFTNICEFNSTNIKIMNTSISDPVARGRDLFSTTLNGDEIKCIFALMPSLQFDPCQVLHECVSEFIAYENCTKMYDRMKEAVNQSCHGKGELSGSMKDCDPLFPEAGKCQNASSHVDSDYNVALDIYDFNLTGGSTTEAPIWPAVRVIKITHRFPAKNEGQALIIVSFLLVAGIIIMICLLKFCKCGRKQNRYFSTQLFHDSIV